MLRPMMPSKKFTSAYGYIAFYLCSRENESTGKVQTHEHRMLSLTSMEDVLHV
jgi:hypothetical protein